MADADERSLSPFINRVLRQHVEATRGKKQPRPKG
jgi:hypothetical protein